MALEQVSQVATSSHLSNLRRRLVRLLKVVKSHHLHRQSLTLTLKTVWLLVEGGVLL